MRVRQPLEQCKQGVFKVNSTTKFGYPKHVRWASVPHGGFGLGVERTVAWICNLKHIRETIPYPRMMGRFYP